MRPLLWLLLAVVIGLLPACNRAGTRPTPAIQAAAAPFAFPAIRGLTLVAPPDSFATDPMTAVCAVGANWIAVVPYAFTPPGTPDVRYNEHGMQWWGERPEGVRTTIRLAHNAGLRVMLKPQVWLPRGWTGTLDFDSPEAWTAWENAYSKYILSLATVAADEHAELFCIGTEFANAIRKRPDYWHGLIRQVRRVFPGKLTYSANWDDWDQAPFWSELDYIGLGGYFPLVQGPTPSVDSLKFAWKPVKARLQAFSARWNKPVLFTEFGYLSVDGAGWKNWELENGVEGRPINQQAQANCYEALFASMAQEHWWAGGFLWKWFPNMQGHEGYPERDYTPQGKSAEQVLRKWYGAGGR